MNSNILEGVKELIRVILLAIIPVVYLSVEQGQVDWRAVALIGVVAGLRAVEKWLHKIDAKVQLPI